jgi:hypothetical protein
MASKALGVEVIMSRNSDCGCGDSHGSAQHSLGLSQPSFDAQGALGDIGGGPSIDASRPQFRVGNNAQFSEFLHALPMVKGTPVQGSVVSSTSTELLVQVQRASAVVAADFYTLASASVTEVTANVVAPDVFSVGRIGARVVVLGLDQRSTASGTAQDFAWLQTQVATASVMRKLSSALGTGSPSSGSFAGLSSFVSMYPAQTATTSSDITRDVT